ncbi:hypothetical protein ACJJTC_004922 [Scirpophaga incertulas]
MVLYRNRTLLCEPPRVLWFYDSKFNRKELILCMRVRTGQVPLNAFKFLMGKRNDPYYEDCPNTKEDLMHILMECARNESDRVDLINYINSPRGCRNIGWKGEGGRVIKVPGCAEERSQRDKFAKIATGPWDERGKLPRDDAIRFAN